MLRHRTAISSKKKKKSEQDFQPQKATKYCHASGRTNLVKKKMGAQ